MKKILKGAVLFALCFSMLFTACTGDNGTSSGTDDGTGSISGGSGLNSETRQLKLSTGALDGNFNPFFYTSQNDGNILSLTQLAMLTTDNDGNLVAGEDEACVVLNYSTNVATDQSQTEYQFVIKNGIKFSDGEELTIKDVLFSLYVYLDPAYTGSATIYSTDIKGLKSYRAQDPKVNDDSDANFDTKFIAEAQTKIDSLIEWSEDRSVALSSQSDLDTVKKLFLEEITSDWTSVSESWESTYEKTHRFTAAWQAYLYNEGLVTVQTKLNSNGTKSELYEDKNGNGERDDYELYYTTLDPDGGVEGNDIQGEEIINEIAAATTKEKVSAYMAENNCDEDYATEQLQKQCCINMVYDTYTDRTEIANVLRYWATASNALEEFTGQARSEYYKNLSTKVDSISGITTEKVTSFKGVNGTETYGEAHDVLKIVINGVDPKAIYNFGFTVAPLHYYSGTYDGVDYVAKADGKTNFGVAVGIKEFFDNVVQATDKNGLPVGAGPYQATNADGDDQVNNKVTRSNFYENNIVYFRRNDNFTTVGSGISNAKIKYVNYKVLSDDKVIDALTTETIDFGMPNATPTNVTKITKYDYLSSKTYKTGGYGYVGINPKYVPEYQVRQAIMKAMDTTRTIDYYGTKLASTIYRPMSTTSWAYPTTSSGTAVGVYEAVKYATDLSELETLVESAGYTKNSNGLYVKTTKILGQGNAELGSTLKLTFTIAGETSDHPAYKMFCDTRDRLNEIGFDITVQTDIQALKKMNSGSLAVWAAAWSSSSDPDPYQIYHKDSKATSVNNWNYSAILNKSDSWGYEYNIITKLSNKIDEGRATLDRSERIDIYAECLDLIMELAVELPTYQRSDLCVYNNKVIDRKTLVQNPSYTMGLFDKLWEIDYVK